MALYPVDFVPGGSGAGRSVEIWGGSTEAQALSAASTTSHA